MLMKTMQRSLDLRSEMMMEEEYVRYEKEIREYASSLEGEEKKVAGEILNDLLRQGHSLRYVLLSFSHL